MLDLTFHRIYNFIDSYALEGVYLPDIKDFVGDDSEFKFWKDNNDLYGIFRDNPSILETCYAFDISKECIPQNPPFFFDDTCVIQKDWRGPDGIPNTPDDCGCPDRTFCKNDGLCHPTAIGMN